MDRRQGRVPRRAAGRRRAAAGRDVVVRVRDPESTTGRAATASSSPTSAHAGAGRQLPGPGRRRAASSRTSRSRAARRTAASSHRKRRRERGGAAGQRTARATRGNAATRTASPAGRAVIIYGASWCGPCHQAAAYLKKRGVPFVEKDIEQDSASRREMQAKLAKAGMRGGSIPVLDVRGKILVGFDARAVDQALGTRALARFASASMRSGRACVELLLT